MNLSRSTGNGSLGTGTKHHAVNNHFGCFRYHVHTCRQPRYASLLRAWTATKAWAACGGRGGGRLACCWLATCSRPRPPRHGAVSPDTCLGHHPRLPRPPAVQWCRRCPLGAGACLQRCLVGWCSSSSFKVSRKKLDREQVLIFSLTFLEQRHCQVSES